VNLGLQGRRYSSSGWAIRRHSCCSKCRKCMISRTVRSGPIRTWGRALSSWTLPRESYLHLPEDRSWGNCARDGCSEILSKNRSRVILRNALPSRRSSIWCMIREVFLTWPSKLWPLWHRNPLRSICLRLIGISCVDRVRRTTSCASRRSSAGILPRRKLWNRGALQLRMPRTCLHNLVFRGGLGSNRRFSIFESSQIGRAISSWISGRRKDCTFQLLENISSCWTRFK